MPPIEDELPVARQWYIIDIDRFAEASGSLSVLEFDKHIPFVVKRVFWVSNVPSSHLERGAHAHAELRQVLFCAKGSCEIDLENRAGERTTFSLSEDGGALYLDGPVWRTMRNFSPDCSLMVLCDREYAVDRVLRGHAEFLSL